MTGRDADHAATDGVELLPPPIRPQDMVSSEVETAAATRELENSGHEGTAGGEAEFPESPSTDAACSNHYVEPTEPQDEEEIAASIDNSAPEDEPASEESIETDSLEIEESVEASFDSETSSERNSAEHSEMAEQLTEDVASEGAEINADTPDRGGVVQQVEHSRSEEEMTETNECTTDEVNTSEREIVEIETECESAEETDAGSDAIPEVEETTVIAEHSASAELEPLPEATSESERGEESQPEATSPESAPEEEPVQNAESDTRPDTDRDNQTSTRLETEFDREAKTIAQVSTIVMAITVVVLWLLLR